MTGFLDLRLISDALSKAAFSSSSVLPVLRILRSTPKFDPAKPRGLVTFQCSLPSKEANRGQTTLYHYMNWMMTKILSLERETGAVHALAESGELPAPRATQKMAIVHLPRE